MGRPDTPFLIAYDFIKANPKTSIGEAMRALGISQFTVSKARRKLVEEGVLTKWSNTAHRLKKRRETLHDATPASDAPMSAEELHRVLSQKMREARDGAELRPLAAELIKLLPKPEQDDETGPTPPISDEEMVERGGLMLQGLGPDLSMSAVEWARKYIPGENTESQQEPDANHPDPV